MFGFMLMPLAVRDWSLIKGMGGGYKTETGGERHVKFYPYEKGGGRKNI